MGVLARGVQGLVDRLLSADPARGFRVAHTRDPPGVLLPGRLYAVGSHNAPWCVLLRCPCGCRETLYLDLLPDARPRWDLRLDRRGLPTLTPSVHRTTNCRSHFILQAGHIRWCSHGP